MHNSTSFLSVELYRQNHNPVLEHLCHLVRFCVYLDFQYLNRIYETTWLLGFADLCYFALWLFPHFVPIFILFFQVSFEISLKSFLESVLFVLIEIFISSCLCY